MPLNALQRFPRKITGTICMPEAEDFVAVTVGGIFIRRLVREIIQDGY